MEAWALILLMFFFTPEAPFGQPAPGATVFRHVPDEAFLVVGADVASLLQGASKGMDRLLDAPFLKKSEIMSQGVEGLRMARKMFLDQFTEMGLDPMNDVRYATLALGEKTGNSERLLVVLGGNLPQKALDTFLANKGAKPAGDLWVISPESDSEVLARTKDGEILFGDRGWVEMALAGKLGGRAWKPLLGDYDRKTSLLVAFRPSPAMKEEWKAEGEPLARPLLSHLSGLSLYLGYQGTAIRVLFDDPRLLKSWQGIFEGAGKIMTAAYYAGDGFLAMAEGYLASLEPVSSLAGPIEPPVREMLDVLVNHRKEARDLLGGLFLGKLPQISVRSDTATKSVNLTVTSRAPAAFIMLPGVLSYFLMVRSTSSAAASMPTQVEVVPPVSQPPTPPAPKPAPAPGKP